MKTVPSKTNSSPWLAALSLTALIANPVSSEELYKPGVPDSTPPDKLVDILQEPLPESGNDQVVISDLKGLVFHTSPDYLLVDGWTGETGLVLNQVELPGNQKDLLAQLASYLNKPLTFAGMNSIRRVMESWFSQHDLPVIQVVAPPGQDITSGIVQYVVVTGRRGEVRVEGAEYNDPQWLIQQLDVQPGELLSSKNLNDDIDWLNRTPFREVNALAYTRRGIR